jgi:ABC-2 type transport system ATP-binding protein
VSSHTSVLEVENVSKRFIIRRDNSLKERLINFRRSRVHREEFWALRDIDLTIDTGSTVGLIGPNGSGKSTLLKAVGGIIAPTMGTVRTRGRMAALLELGAGFHPDLTGRENVYLNASILGLTKETTDALFEEIVEFSGVEKFIDTQVKFYSSGMYVRLAFAVAVHVDPDILLVDEVLAVGDEPFQRKCLDKIRQFQVEGRTIVIVSHSASTIGEFCNRAVLLDHGVLAFDGDTAEALAALRRQFEEERFAKNTADEAPGLQAIESVRLFNAQGREVTVVEPGDSLELEVVVASEKLIRGWVVGIGIQTPLGQVVFGTNTMLLDPGEREPFIGQHTVRFSLPNLNLGRGQYTMHASFGVLGDESIVRIPNAVAIEATDGSKNVGVLSVNSSFTEN